MSFTEKTFVPVVALVMFDRVSQTYLIMRRNQHDTGGGSWEFPGGKVETGEPPLLALKREILEELSFELVPEQLIFLLSVDHDYRPDAGTPWLRLSFYRYEVDSQVGVALVDHDAFRWCTSEELFLMTDVAAADLPVIRYLKGR